MMLCQLLVPLRMKEICGLLKVYILKKLKGGRGNKGERSLRLNDQWRLIVRLMKDEEGKLILIINLEDYH